MLIVSFSISYTQYWERIYGENGDCHARSIVQTSDDGFVIVGWKSIYGYSDVYLMKIDNLGTLCWQKSYGGDNNDFAYSVVETFDDGYIIVGKTESFDSGPYGDVYVLKTDSLGNMLWQRTFGGSGVECGNDISQVETGGYIIVGSTSSFGVGTKNIWLIRLNESGDTIWTRTYGGSSVDYGWSVKQERDGSFILSGGTWSFGAEECDYYLIKADSTGDIIWERTYGGSELDYGRSVALALNDGLIMVGSIFSFTAPDCIWIINVNRDGTIVWERTYGMGFDNYGHSIAQTEDGGHIIAGETWGILPLPNLYLLKINADGNTLWERDYGDSSFASGYSVIQTNDNGYIITGDIYPFDEDSSRIYVLKTDSLGEIDWVREIPNRPDDISLSVFPNPFNSVCEITVPENAKIEIYDLRGNVVATPCSADKSASLVPLDKGDRNRASAKVSG
ncbi:hypothetical protein DRQ33_07775, partial [bacterium]